LERLSQVINVWKKLTPAQQVAQIQLWKKWFYWNQHTTIATWFPTPEIRAKYPKQMAHFKDGANYDERGLFGGNRTGKTHCGTFEDTLHLTGLYPDWWEGRRFDHPVDVWTATDTAKNTRDILQEKFCGKPGVPALLGTGMIPVDFFATDPTTKHGVAHAFESCFIHHVTNGINDGTSTLQFKSYDQGRQSFQGTAQDLIHLDEEPKLEIYTECALRLMSTVPGQKNGSLILTETPLLGVSELMIMFMPDLAPAPQNPLQDFDVGEEMDIDE
jgi:phage terminase large subunit-like protein